MFWKKKKAPEKKANILLGMVLLNTDQPFSLESFKKDYAEHYEVQVNTQEGDSSTAVFELEGEMAAISFMPVPVPTSDIESTAPYAYNWPTAIDDLKTHQSHIIVSVLNGSDDDLKRHVMFTWIVCSLLRTNDAAGVYVGGQSLLLQKEYYLEAAGTLDEDNLPVDLWVYVGLRKNNEKNSGYTYGLTAWGKLEMEIVDSGQPLSAIREFLLNLVHYVIAYDVEFQDGQTCGVSEGQKIKISLSKAKWVEGKSFKLDF